MKPMQFIKIPFLVEILLICDTIAWIIHEANSWIEFFSHLSSLSLDDADDEFAI